MELIYKKADVNDINDLVDLKIKQNILMQMILDFLDEIECKKIELDAVNPDAIKLYEKFGFKKDDEKYILNN